MFTDSTAKCKAAWTEHCPASFQFFLTSNQGQSRKTDITELIGGD